MLSITLNEQCKARRHLPSLATFARWRCHCNYRLSTPVSGFGQHLSPGLLTFAKWRYQSVAIFWPEVDFGSAWSKI